MKIILVLFLVAIAMSMRLRKQMDPLTQMMQENPDMMKQMGLVENGADQMKKFVADAVKEEDAKKRRK